MTTSPVNWIDSHCHLQDAEDLDAVLARASAVGVGGIVCIGTDAETSQCAVEIASSEREDNVRPKIWATIGLHPHEAKNGAATIASLVEDVRSTRARSASGSVVAIGECGLDFHYEHSPRDEQRVCFAEQIALANELDLALVVHTRDAWDETISILQAEGVPTRTIIHCFSGGEREAQRCLDLGAFLSFSGIVTFKNATDVRAAVESCPADRLLLETDAPWLAPVPHRGKANEPAYVALVGETVAALRGTEPSELAVTTSENCIRAFALAL